jgi:hypothetical protein
VMTALADVRVEDADGMVISSQAGYWTRMEAKSIF